MKTRLLIAALGLVAASPALAEERQIDLSVPGMTCASCPYVVQAAIGAVDGVISVTTDLDTRRARVVFDDAIATVDAIEAASTDAGYAAELIPDGADQS